MKEVPKQYKLVLDEAVLTMADEVRKIDYIIEELGHTLEFEVDNHIITIKRKEKTMENLQADIRVELKDRLNKTIHSPSDNIIHEMNDMCDWWIEINKDESKKPTIQNNK